MALSRRFKKAGEGGIDVPAALLFFGRDIHLQSKPQEGVIEPSGGVRSQENRESQGETLRENLQQAKNEEERLASEVEVRTYEKHVEHFHGTDRSLETSGSRYTRGRRLNLEMS